MAALASSAAEAAAAIGSAQSRYAATGRLDSEMLNRHGKISEAVRKETRQGIGWYEATHTGRAPLKNVSIPHGKTPVVFPLDVVAAALATAVAAEGSFPAADWLPPADPDHATLCGAPLDLPAPWVRSAALRLHGPKCALCGASQPPADTVVEEGGRLQLVHGACLRKPASEQEKKRAERLAKMQAHGFPPPPHWTGDGDE